MHMWIVYMNIFDILIHDITNIKSKTMVQKRSFYMNVTNLKRVRRRSLTRMRKQNTTLKSHIRLTIVSFNKLCIILDSIPASSRNSITLPAVQQTRLQFPLLTFWADS